ncbi:inactive tyrosine-protein kinase PEAK1 isoform X1 [Monodelphis domestica]|uniref:inactive tyrosine-protein kinase PEAK1 isoform X1 n=1 Tax=Monodelphis domestica TaxID=13616 RepID=UPI0024E1BB84|nr:inactive tyrosine-protein kinase PEAK1 isoform X1 [Monodelphis domestica]XP_007478036.2 inactive tyrosine-protein kinase PEAK1 isoform X1 [Monodelphis domestica]XP_007478037.2 inactive tyrosine-protein kinase PEAK1 isoform X1 [Monodelphis domestica]XP_007478038.2 inactive tyrosine-protein kinase PEAK1 isoform X1 [Monodelphis domestica]XP_007478039.2 inactive tyrosine-protein kinase PEAK1 isoform X1 [Monodelphis domestica]XP_056652692.1 inactive tyrosine-protein kinase PEAK1 isoform X1 [Mono
MSACNTFTEHVWKPGECKNCFKPKSLHQLPPPPEAAPLPHGSLKTNANHSNNHRVRNTGNFRPPVAKKPTIAVKPTMMVAGGQSMSAEAGTPEHCENKPVIISWNRNRASLSKKPLNNNNNNEEEIEGFSHVHRPFGPNDSVSKIANNNNGLTEVLKEIVGLDPTPQQVENENNSRETFLGRISNCYKRSLERKLPPSCMMGGMKDSQRKHVILSGSTEVISNEGGRFCYPEFSSEDESEDDAFFSSMHEEHESWDESDEELLAMEIRMRGQPRFANFRANTLSPVRFFVGKKWNTVPLRNKSLQRICAVDYDDSYDEILNGYGEDSVIPYGQESMQSVVSSDSTSPESSLTEESRSGTASSSSQKLCNGGTSPSTPKDVKEIKSVEPDDENSDNQPVKDVADAPKSPAKVLETHKAVLALRLEEKDGKIALQTEKQESKSSTDLAGQAVTINLVPLEEQAKPYRVVNLEQPVCKPYTIVDVSAAMTGEHAEGQAESPKPRSAVSTPNSPLMSPTSTSAQAHFKKSSTIRYQEVWTSSTSPRQKMPKVELATGGTGPTVPPRKNSHKSAPTSPTATNVSSKTIPVKSPNLSEIKFNSYNNAGMPPFPIIIHDEPTYARSAKNAIKVPIVINPNAYDNLAIYKSFLGTSGELSTKEKTTSVISHTYEEIETECKGAESPGSKPAEGSLGKGRSNSTEHRKGSVAQKVQEFNSCLGRGQPSPPRRQSSAQGSPARPQRTTQESVARVEGPLESSTAGGGGREKASTVLSQIVASIQPPQSPPETPPSGPEACGVEELYALPPGDETPSSPPTRPKSLFATPQPSHESEVAPAVQSPGTQGHKELPSQPATGHSTKFAASTPTPSPQTEPGPPFPPPRSTSSPYHASNLLQRHFSHWSKPTSPTRATEAESILNSEGRRGADNKPKRWISFKSFFRRKKADEDEDKEKEREKGKLVGLDGTVIHMLPPPPVQRHHWFTESRTDASEKPSIVFMYRCDSAQGAEPGADSDRPGVERVVISDKSELEERILRDAERKQRSPSPSRLPKKSLSQVPHEGPAEGAPPRVPGKEAGSDAPAGLPALPPHTPEREEDASDPSDDSPCRATYSNLGQSRATMIPPKHPRQPKGATDDAIAFGGTPELEATPPPLPKKTILRANTEPLPRALENHPCLLANPTYDLEARWDGSSAGSSLSSEPRGPGPGSCDSLDRPLPRDRRASSLVPFSTSTESLAGRRGPPGRQSKSAQKPQRTALYRGLDSRDELVAKIRSLHGDALKKLALQCEDLFMAGQKDQLRFGVDSWSDFRLTSDRPCCEAGDAVYYQASYAKEPLSSYAVKICKSKAKESQQYYHSLAVRQSLAVHFNIQQDCGHFLAEVPLRLLPWEDPDTPGDEDEDGDGEGGGAEAGAGGGPGQQRSHVVVITREVPHLTVADFVRESSARHGRSPDAYERQVCLLLLQLCSGLEHLKPYHVTHCDLRLENLLLIRGRPEAEAGPARLLVSNFSQAKQKSRLAEPEALRDRSRLAPEILTATQYKKCDEFQTGILIYEMLHLANPFDESPGLKEREYTRADLPRIPCRSPYSWGLQQLAGCLLHPNPSERILISDAKGVLQCLLWGPRQDLFPSLGGPAGPRGAALQSWLDIKRTLLMVKFAEKALDRAGGVSLEDWLCAQYLAFATTDSLGGIVDILQQR